MKAYKCDRCKNFFDGESLTLAGKMVHVAFLEYGWFPSQIELCRDCSNSFSVVLRDWWGDTKVPPVIDLRLTKNG